MSDSTFSVSLGKERLQLRMEHVRYTQRRYWQTLRHCHGEYELHILLAGRCRVAVQERLLQLSSGQSLLLPPGEYHNPDAVEGDFLRFSLSFSPESPQLQHALQLVLPESMVLPLPKELLQLCEDIFQECAAGNPFKTELKQAMLTQLMIRLLRLLGLQELQRTQPDSLSEDQRINRIDDYFEKHFSEPAGEEALAQMLHLSRRQLDRVLWKHYGMGYRQKLILARMDHAAWLLRTTPLPISRIAEQIGYTSDSAFFQIFRQHFGMTPCQYRQRSRETV